MREAVKLLGQQKDAGKGRVSEDSEDSEDHSDDSDEDDSQKGDRKLDKVKSLAPKKKDEAACPSSLQKRTVRRLPKRGYVSMPNM
ncbi:hypothetical protein SERLADRAFT_391481 [Serpula lacrymans var. lacrymans S7.9]|uniref:Uncharacterized protein n=1 Tax=Serpula lacrymans var. lacrymans (strain S7.9) TaxID=578457 RepID=F8P0A0_SERL9|nr:uncharacterized protein SERLADRAFT_391481 [Serpula lacrymans var. lacrymans S7.9]EGO23473.1 hypothetical protein SERLADRAFT_391481 [Serpula lacrymans var. lacrymans S7.9]